MGLKRRAGFNLDSEGRKGVVVGRLGMMRCLKCDQTLTWLETCSLFMLCDHVCTVTVKHDQLSSFLNENPDKRGRKKSLSLTPSKNVLFNPTYVHFCPNGNLVLVLSAAHPLNRVHNPDFQRSSANHLASRCAPPYFC